MCKERKSRQLVKSRKWFYPVICRSSRVMVKSYSMSICREIVKLQHVHLPWNCQIAARRDIVELSNRQITAWAICREIFKLQHRTKDVNCTFDPSPASTRQTTNSSVNDFQIERRFDADFNDSWIAALRGFKPCQADRELKRFGFNDSSIAALRGFKPCQANPPRAERQIRRCKRFSDWNDSPPASPCRGFKPCQANHELKRFGFVPSACRMTILRVPNDKFVDVNDSQIETIRLPASPRRFQQFVDCRPPVPNDPVCDSRIFLALKYITGVGESRQNIICFGVEWIFGDVLLVSRAKTYYVWI